MRWFVGGQQRLMPELLAMVASTVNSFTRLMPGLLGAHERHLGLREPNHRASRDRRRSQKPAGRVPGRRRRYQSVHRAGRCPRLRPLGRGKPHRADSAGRGRRLRRQPFKPTGVPRHAGRSGRTPQELGHGEGMVRRRLRRPFRQHPAVGGAPIPTAPSPAGSSSDISRSSSCGASGDT